MVETGGSTNPTDHIRKKEGQKRNFRPDKMSSKGGPNEKENAKVLGREKTKRSGSIIKKRKFTWKEKEKWPIDSIRREVEVKGSGLSSGLVWGSFNPTRGETSSTKESTPATAFID